MEVFVSKTLEQVQEALEEVEQARENAALTAKEKLCLENISVSLRKMERAIMRKKEQELLKALIEDSKELTKLTKQIKDSAEKLGKVSVVLEKTSQVVGALIKIFTAAFSAGFL